MSKAKNKKANYPSCPACGTAVRIVISKTDSKVYGACSVNCGWESGSFATAINVKDNGYHHRPGGEVSRFRMKGFPAARIWKGADEKLWWYSIDYKKNTVWNALTENHAKLALRSWAELFAPRIQRGFAMLSGRLGLLDL